MSAAGFPAALAMAHNTVMGDCLVIGNQHVMSMSVAECERYAQRFDRMASEAKDEYIRERLLEIARAWTAMARERQNDGSPR